MADFKSAAVRATPCPCGFFYRAFSDELNFGYRELMKPSQLKSHLEKEGFQVEKTFTLPAHNLVASRVRHGKGDG